MEKHKDDFIDALDDLGLSGREIKENGIIKLILGKASNALMVICSLFVALRILTSKRK